VYSIFCFIRVCCLFRVRKPCVAEVSEFFRFGLAVSESGGLELWMPEFRR
jgi:hypothetical protein